MNFISLKKPRSLSESLKNPLLFKEHDAEEDEKKYDEVFSSQQLKKLEEIDTTIQTVEVYRHGFSCANAKKIKAKNNKIMGMLFTKRQQMWELDPGLTIWGILSMIEQGTILVDPKKKKQMSEDEDEDENEATEVDVQERGSINIYVSVLFRTWATAICLFLPRLQENGTLTLFVSPYLKETTIGQDNAYGDIETQLAKLEHFYKTLSTISSTKIKSHTLEIKKGAETYTYNLRVEDEQITITRNGTHGTSVAVSDLHELNPQYLEDQRKYLTESQRKVKTEWVDYPGINTLSDLESLPDPISESEYDKGDFVKFLAWVKSKDTNSKIFVVSHSHVMQDFAKIVLKGKKTILENVVDNNAWGISFKMMNNVDQNLKISSIKIYPGSPKPEYYVQASACEPECDYGKTSARRRWRSGTKARVEKCKHIMNGKSTRSNKKLYTVFEEEAHREKAERENAERENAEKETDKEGFMNLIREQESQIQFVGGGKRITRKRKAKKSRKSRR